MEVHGNKNKKLVRLSERVKQVGGTLIIREARVEDSGKYLCMVNNSVGGESVETVLTVTGETRHTQSERQSRKLNGLRDQVAGLSLYSS